MASEMFSICLLGINVKFQIANVDDIANVNENMSLKCGRDTP